MKVGILAGEASGDNLGAGLMRELKAQTSPSINIEFVGIGGPGMQAQGLCSLADIEQLNVNGFREPLQKLPSLLKLLRFLVNEFVTRGVDVFIGVDFNVFNFLLETRLKKAGIRTVHYVSPSVYAWRSGRAEKIEKSTDLLLCLYPFEPDYYRNTQVEAVFVGHPLADEIRIEDGQGAAKQQAQFELGLTSDGGKPDKVLAILPGSRSSEVRLMLAPFLEAAVLLKDKFPDLRFVIPCLREVLQHRVSQAIASDPRYQALDIKCYQGNARLALLACDVALIKSGTSTLEAMLLHRPMVVSYRLGWLSYQFAKRVLRTPYIALPNILAGKPLVKELLQYEGTPQNLAAALAEQLKKQEVKETNDKKETEENDGGSQEQAFLALHKQLARTADRQAAAAVLGLIDTKG
ncbi:MAG: lipid-A-disaccharide synthase [Pseudomonadota bacterium]